MSALSSATQHARAGAGGAAVRAGRQIGHRRRRRRGGRARPGGQPAQRLFDVGHGADARRRELPRRRDPLRRQMRRCRSGMVTVNVVPCASPALHRARRRRAASPARAPAPARCRCLRACARAPASRDGSAGTCAADPPPECRRRCRRPAARRGRRATRRVTRDLALEGELERVGEQVEDDLLPHVAIDVDRLGQRRAVHHEPQAGLLDRGAEHARELGGERRPGRWARSWRRCGPASMREKSSSVFTSLSSRRLLRCAMSSGARPRRPAAGRAPGAARLRAGPASASAACGTRARRWRRTRSWRDRARPGSRRAAAPPRAPARRRDRRQSGVATSSKNVR